VRRIQKGKVLMNYNLLLLVSSLLFYTATSQSCSVPAPISSYGSSCNAALTITNKLSWDLNSTQELNSAFESACTLCKDSFNSYLSLMKSTPYCKNDAANMEKTYVSLCSKSSLNGNFCLYYSASNTGYNIYQNLLSKFNASSNDYFPNATECGQVECCMLTSMKNLYEKPGSAAELAYYSKVYTIAKRCTTNSQTCYSLLGNESFQNSASHAKFMISMICTGLLIALVAMLL
jgi:hypothetical protein